MPLSERWEQLCATMGAKTKVRGTYNDLVSHYQEVGRAYHSLSHITKCLEEYDLLKAEAENGIAVECAIWFHDAIYDTRAKDNEQKSAILAESALGGMGIAGELPRTVGSLILVTKHDRSPSTVDEQIVVDVDLAILGAPTETFDEYEAQIRNEYSWVSDAVFWSKRREVLAALSARPCIYFTARCRDKYEAPARRNLQRSFRKADGYKGVLSQSGVVADGSRLHFGPLKTK